MKQFIMLFVAGAIGFGYQAFAKDEQAELCGVKVVNVVIASQGTSIEQAIEDAFVFDKATVKLCNLGAKKVLIITSPDGLSDALIFN